MAYHIWYRTQDEGWIKNPGGFSSLEIAVKAVARWAQLACYMVDIKDERGKLHATFRSGKLTLADSSPECSCCKPLRNELNELREKISYLNMELERVTGAEVV